MAESKGQKDDPVIFEVPLGKYSLKVFYIIQRG